MDRSPREIPRRRLLESVGVTGGALAAGCLSLPSRTVSCPNEIHISLDEASKNRGLNEFNAPVEGLSFATRTVVADALETGDATARGYYLPNPRTEYVVTGSNEHFYRVTTTERNRTETTGYEYAVEIGVNESTVSDEQVHRFEELPDQDRESLRSALGNTHLIHAPHYTSFSVVFAYEHDEDREQSVFVPDADVQYVEWEDTLLRVTFEAQRPVTIASATVTTDRVATSPDEFVAHIRAAHGVVLDDLTSRQREIVTRAIEDGYTECNPHSEPVTALLDRLSLDGRDDAWLARYDDSWYFLTIYRADD